MKLASYTQGQDTKLGAVIGTEGLYTVLDLHAAAARKGVEGTAFASMLALIDAGQGGLDRAARLIEDAVNLADIIHPLASVKLKAPVPQPPQMRDASVFPEHITGAPRGMARLMARLQGNEEAEKAAQALPEIPQAYRDRPIFYITNRFSVGGNGDEVRWPTYSKVMDFELEVGIFLSKGGTDIAKSAARDHIFGYTIFNDFSARDMQRLEMQGMLGPAKGKSFQGGNVIGPWIVTKDEIPDPYALKARALVNGEVWTESSTAGMLHDFEDMIAYISRDETLHPGEFIGSGTVNRGCGLELDRFLQHGDEIALEVENIGVLKNRVVRQDI